MPGIYQLINFSASLGTALLAVWVGQQMVNERLLSAPMEVAHRIVIAVVSLAFLVNAMQDQGPIGAFLATACFVFFLLRALARQRYPHGHRRGLFSRPYSGLSPDRSKDIKPYR